MRVLVCGGRNFSNQEAVFHELHELAFKHGSLVVINGGATGADYLARSWAWALKGSGHVCQTFRADWQKHGRAAGPLRNQRMLDEGKPDLVLAFPGGKGTADMVAKARKCGVEVVEPISAPTDTSAFRNKNN